MNCFQSIEALTTYSESPQRERVRLVSLFVKHLLNPLLRHRRHATHLMHGIENTHITLGEDLGEDGYGLLLREDLRTFYVVLADLTKIATVFMTSFGLLRKYKFEPPSLCMFCSVYAVLLALTVPRYRSIYPDRKEIRLPFFGETKKPKRADVKKQ